jgi:hypothetical protein
LTIDCLLAKKAVRYNLTSDFESAVVKRRPVVANAFNQVIGGQKDVNTALREAEEAANKKIAELKSK